MTTLGKFLVLAGLGLAVAGLAVWGVGRLTEGRGLPGDLRLERENLRIHVPIVTMIVVSILLTLAVNLALWLWRLWNR